METTTMKLRVLTWNGGDEKHPSDLKPLLGLDVPTSEHLPDMVAVGLQELVDDDAWFEMILQEFKAKGYMRVKTRTMQAVTTQVYVLRKHLKAVTNVESEITRTGFGGVIGNKGGVSVRLDFYGVNMIFVNAHFQAHLEHYADRIEDFNDIISTQKFKDDSVEVILDHDYVFWTGDLNFRIDDLDKPEIERLIKKNDLKALWPHEQLMKAMKENLLFVDFMEGQLDFPPTFKFDKGSQTYDTSKKLRKPAWTDRILWMVHEDSFKGVTLGADLIKYTSLPTYTTSDHKPVVGEFNIKILKNCPPMPVYFFRISDIKPKKNLNFSYKLDADVSVSTSDWIGLYKHDFAHYNDYVTYVRAEDAAIGEKIDLVIDHSYIKESSGQHMLAYFSKTKNCLIGYSNNFKVC